MTYIAALGSSRFTPALGSSSNLKPLATTPQRQRFHVHRCPDEDDGDESMPCRDDVFAFAPLMHPSPSCSQERERKRRGEEVRAVRGGGVSRHGQVWARLFARRAGRDPWRVIAAQFSTPRFSHTKTRRPVLPLVASDAEEEYMSGKEEGRSRRPGAPLCDDTQQVRGSARNAARNHALSAHRVTFGVCPC